MAMAAMLSSGCASYMVVQGRNAELDRKAVQLAVTPNGGTAAIDFLGLKGYWAAWKAEPVKMTGATLLDAGTAAGAALLVNELTKDDGDSKQSPPAIENNGGTVIINTGSGDTSYTTTTTGAPE
jgi:hypothetical protein